MPSPAYRALAAYSSSATFDSGTGRTVGLEFSVSEFCWLSTIWYYRPSTAVALPTGDVAGCWTVTPGADAASTTGTLIAGSTAVTWVATADQVGWIPGLLATPILLAPGLIFRAGVWNKGTVHGLANYYSTGAGKDGFVNGPLRVPSAAAAVNLAQGVFTAGTARAFPNTVAKTNYGVDVTVEPDPDLIQGLNECLNPASGVDASGWYSPSTIVGRVTGLSGLSRSTGYRATSDGFSLAVQAPMLTVTPGETVTAIIQSIVSAAGSYRAQVIFRNASRGYISGADASAPTVTLAAGAVYQSPAIVATAPTAAAFALILVSNTDSTPPSNGQLTGTAVRYRRGSWPSLGYIDGDTAKCVWDGVAGKSTSRRDPKVFVADTDSTSAATVGTAIGYAGTQRQDGNGTFVTNPAAIPVEAAPFARPGRASRVDIATGYQRIEQNPQHREFAAGEDYYFGFAFALAAGFPTGVADFWVIEQLHGAPSTGSPVLAFETRGWALRLSGGANRPGAASAGQYAYDRLLVPNLRVNRWYHVVYRVQFSDQPGGGSIDVWVDGVQRLAGFAPPCGTVYGTDISSEGGTTYRKSGCYKRPSLEGGTVWHAATALGTSYAAVDPTRSQVIATSESLSAVYC